MYSTLYDSYKKKYLNQSGGARRSHQRKSRSLTPNQQQIKALVDEIILLKMNNIYF